MACESSVSLKENPVRKKQRKVECPFTLETHFRYRLVYKNFEIRLGPEIDHLVIFGNFL